MLRSISAINRNSSIYNLSLFTDSRNAAHELEKAMPITRGDIIFVLAPLHTNGNDRLSRPNHLCIIPMNLKGHLCIIPMNLKGRICHYIYKDVNPYNVEIFLYKPWTQKSVFSIWYHHKCLFKRDLCRLKWRYFRFIWIPRLWVYSHYNSTAILILSVRRLSLDVRYWRLKTIPALKGLRDLLIYCISI